MKPENELDPEFTGVGLSPVTSETIVALTDALKRSFNAHVRSKHCSICNKSYWNLEEHLSDKTDEEHIAMGVHET